MSVPFLLLCQYFRATMVLSLHPTSPRILSFGLLWLWFLANPVIREVMDVLKEQMVK